MRKRQLFVSKSSYLHPASALNCFTLKRVPVRVSRSRYSYLRVVWPCQQCARGDYSPLGVTHWPPAGVVVHLSFLRENKLPAEEKFS